MGGKNKSFSHIAFLPWEKYTCFYLQLVLNVCQMLVRTSGSNQTHLDWLFVPRFQEASVVGRGPKPSLAEPGRLHGQEEAAGKLHLKQNPGKSIRSFTASKVISYCHDCWFIILVYSVHKWYRNLCAMHDFFNSCLCLYWMGSIDILNCFWFLACFSTSIHQWTCTVYGAP